MTVDGYCYDRASIERWLQNNNTPPMTNLPLESTNLIPNIGLRAQIEDSDSKQSRIDKARNKLTKSEIKVFEDDILENSK